MGDSFATLENIQDLDTVIIIIISVPFLAWMRMVNHNSKFQEVKIEQAVPAETFDLVQVGFGS